MTTTKYDLGLEYLGGVTAPTADEDGRTARAHVDPTTGDIGFVYAGPQTLSASGSWDGVAETLLVTGSGARTIDLPRPTSGYARILVVDAAGNAASGTITLDPAGADTIAGAATITANNGMRTVVYKATGAWVSA